MTIRLGANEQQIQGLPHKAIFISFCLTVTCALVASNSKVTTFFNSYYRPEKIEGQNTSLNNITNSFVANYLDADPVLKSGLMEKFVASRSPPELNYAVNYLLKKDNSKEKKQLAIRIAQSGGYRYKNTRLLLITAAEYINATNIEKNLEIAKYNLDQIKADSSGSKDYYNGLILADPKNPNYNREKARLYLKKASATGLKLATQALAKLEMDAN